LKKPDPLWQRFDPVRTKETGGDLKSLAGKFVNFTIPAGSTHRDEVEAIARQFQPPVAIKSLEEKLSEKRFVRSKTIYGLVADEIDEIAANYEDMHWWVSEDGLNMAIMSPATPKLSRLMRWLEDSMSTDRRVGNFQKHSLSRSLGNWMAPDSN
jgi:hypothetical protein